MRVISASVVSLFWLLFIAAESALACSCALSRDPDVAISRLADRSERIFVGKVTSQKMIEPSNESSELQESELSIAWAWKGTLAKTVVLRIDIQCCVCGIHLRLNEEYLIFAFQDRDGHLSASFCSSRHIDNADELIEALNRKYPNGAWASDEFQLKRSAGLQDSQARR